MNLAQASRKSPPPHSAFFNCCLLSGHGFLFDLVVTVCSPWFKMSSAEAAFVKPPNRCGPCNLSSSSRAHGEKQQIATGTTASSTERVWPPGFLHISPPGVRRQLSQCHFLVTKPRCHQHRWVLQRHWPCWEQEQQAPQRQAGQWRPGFLPDDTGGGGDKLLETAC